MKAKLTERNISRIKASAKDEYRHDYTAWDTEIPGFGLRVQNGRATWVMQYQVHGRQHRVKLGDQATMSADMARSAAKQEGARVDRSRRTGEAHPISERKRIADEMARAEAKRPGDAPFGSRIDEYLAARTGNGNGLREKSLIETRRYLEQTFKALHKIPLAEIRRVDVANVLSEIKSAAVSNRARSTLSTFYAWAIGRGWVDINPVAGTIKADEAGERQRVLTDDEIATVWLAADQANGYGTILKLLLLTGCRRDEIGGLMWSEVDLNARTITIPGSRTKNKQEHVVPLSDLANEILAGIARREGREHVFGRTVAAGFSGWSSAKAEFDAVVNIPEWVVHDLRRTVRTGIDKLGILPHVCEAVLNHLPEKLIRTYNRNTYETEKRNALNAWAHHLKTIVAQATGANVTPIRKGDGRKPRR
jgi:integrase